MITWFLMCFKEHRDLIVKLEAAQNNARYFNDALNTSLAWNKDRNTALAVEIAVLKSKLTRKPKVKTIELAAEKES